MLFDLAEIHNTPIVLWVSRVDSEKSVVPLVVGQDVVIRKALHSFDVTGELAPMLVGLVDAMVPIGAWRIIQGIPDGVIPTKHAIENRSRFFVFVPRTNNDDLVIDGTQGETLGNNLVPVSTDQGIDKRPESCMPTTGVGGVLLGVRVYVKAIKCNPLPEV